VQRMHYLIRPPRAAFRFAHIHGIRWHATTATALCLHGATGSQNLEPSSDETARCL
jgi:hypothetical protein